VVYVFVPVSSDSESDVLLTVLYQRIHMVYVFVPVSSHSESDVLLIVLY